MMKLGALDFERVQSHLELVAEPVADSIEKHKLPDVLVAEIDPSLADTMAFCDEYKIGLEISANCVIVEAKRADRTWYAACMILATSRVDVNNIVRRHLDARKISFAPMDTAVKLTGMEYGGINPIGLPDDWPILIDTQVDAAGTVIIGSGIRGSKILISAEILAKLPNARVMDIALHKI